MTKCKINCWYCGAAISSANPDEFDKHTKEQGASHSRFLIEKDTSAGNVSENLPLEEGLMSTNEDLLARAKASQPNVDASQPNPNP